MNWFAQLFALTGYNLRTIPQRKGSVIATMVGIAGVVGVFVGVLSIAHGLQKTMQSTGSPDTVIVMRSGADSEMVSILDRDSTRVIAEAPGLAKVNGKALASPELFVIVNLPKKSTGTDANVPLRGVHPEGFAVREKLRIVEGRTFQPGRNEVIVGRGARAEFRGLDLGANLQFGQSRWTVVGVFESGGSVAESEIWTDASVLAPAYRRGTFYQVVIAKLASAGTFTQFKDALTRDPRLNIKVLRETEYYAEQSQMLVKIITGLGAIIAGLMALGAVFGALNTMYTAVASRAREIATLRAVGFGAGAVVVSIVIESLLLALTGGVIGAVLAHLLFDGYRAATLNWQSFSQVAFAFDVSFPLLMEGIIWAALIGTIGGLFPAIRAARMQVATALRAA